MSRLQRDSSQGAAAAAVCQTLVSALSKYDTAWWEMNHVKSFTAAGHASSSAWASIAAATGTSGAVDVRASNAFGDLKSDTANAILATQSSNIPCFCFVIVGDVLSL